jgi:hypothetical protein
MNAAAAWIDGLKRTTRAPWLVAGVWLLTVLVSLPLAAVLRGMIAQQLGHSIVADSVATGANDDWMQEFAAQASGIGVTFRPTIIGFAAVLDNASAFLDNLPRPLVIIGAASAYIAIWIFLAGGIIDRLARDRPTGAAGFFASCGVFFFRFLRLATLQWIVYAVLFGAVHAYLFGDLYRTLTRETTVERNAFLLRATLYAVFSLLVGGFNALFDFAKVRAVVEDRRSMIGAIAAAARLLGRNGAAWGVYGLNVAVFVAIVALYGVVAPGAGHSAITMWMAVGIGQAYVLARLWLKVLFWSSETALFQSRLAHAGYVAAPPHRWPDSPAAEAIRAS